MEPLLESRLGRGLFAARWLAAPIYVGLVVALGILLIVLVKYLALILAHIASTNLHDAMVSILSLVDLTLIANLVLIVLFTGFDSFISRLQIDDHEDRPAWLGQIDFTALKFKLFASIAAITGIELLKAFLDLSEARKVDPKTLTWLVTIHLVFMLTTIGAAFSQWLVARAKIHP